MVKLPTGAFLPVFEETAAETPPALLHLRVYWRLRDAILSGYLTPGDRLPSSRTLARDLKVSRNTVEAAFSQLDTEGYVERRVGAGTFVGRNLPAKPASRQVEPIAVAPAPGAPCAGLSRRGRGMVQAGEGTGWSSPRVFTPCTPALDAFPMRVWQKLLARHSRRLGRELLKPPDPAGYRPLREAIAGYLGTFRGVQCDWRRVVVLGSTQQGIDLASRLLLDPGDAVWMEDPGYPGARAALANGGARLVPVPVDENGMDVEEGIRRAPLARLAYVTPSHQYPLGSTLCTPRRLALVDWAARSGAWLFEDDYDSEFRYTGRPLAAVQGLDRAGRVIYAGTFNKAMFPALRLAYLVLPEALVDPFIRARSALDGPTGILPQALLADFISDGHFGAHIRTMRNVYQERRHTLVHTAEAELAEWLSLGPTDTGLHATGYLGPGSDDRAVSAAAREKGLDVPALSGYYAGDPAARGLILHYASAAAPEIRKGIALLRTVLRG